MFTVALIGGDGAGKTTIAKALEAKGPFPAKYIYMGPSIASREKSLPTSRLALHIKLRKLRREMREAGEPVPETISSDTLNYRPTKRGPIWLTLRLVNRIVEAVYNEILSRSYRLRGYIVLYDRFFFFNITYPLDEIKKWSYTIMMDRLEYWFFKYCFPKPNLVIFLDASPEVLYSRKGESNIESLRKTRLASLALGQMVNNFVRIDADQPYESVLEEVTNIISNFRNLKH